MGAHRDVLLRLGAHFLGEDRLEEVAVGRLLGRRVLEQGLEPLATLEEAQALAVLLEPFELGGGRHAPPPAWAQAS